MEKRIIIFSYIVFLVFAVFLLRLWNLQVVKGGEYKRISENNRLRIVEIPAPRGIIYDRKNRALVRNVPSFDISVVIDLLPNDPEILTAMAGLIGIELEDIKASLTRTFRNPFEPIKLKENVTMEEVARVEAARIDFPSLQVDVVISREYIYNETAGHVIGYLGRLTLEQLNDPDYRDVPVKAYTGQLGTEKVFDKILRGEAGKRIIEVDATGRVIRDVGKQSPVNGRDIILTLDMKIQEEAENSLKNKAGSVVVLDVNSGEILAMASSPSFDPNLFSRGINYKEWQALVSHRDKPFLNRSIQSQYPPGSTFKIVSALAALEIGIITDKSRFECKGSINFGREFRCWKLKGHGSVDLYRAIVESCDVYFYELAKRMRIDTIARYAMNYGLGSQTGIELEGERSGIVPSTDWKIKTKKQRWYKGETLNTVIGQGYLSATPLQMARLMAAVVNGGKLYKSHILKNPGYSPEDYETIEIRPENIRLIKEALLGVVSDKDGTGWMARSDIVKIGGKTGTTQVVGRSDESISSKRRFRDHAWFIAFAPEKNPQISVAVFVEHGGHGSTAAAPIAKRVIEKYFECGMGNSECGTKKLKSARHRRVRRGGKSEI